MSDPKKSGSPPRAAASPHVGVRSTPANVARASLALTALEDATLELARLVFALHAGAEPASWVAALELAERAVGPFEGPLFAGRVTGLMRAVLAERDGAFACLPVGSGDMCPDEEALMRVVRLAQTGPFVELRAAAQAFSGGMHVSRVLAAAIALAQPTGLIVPTRRRRLANGRRA